MCRPDDFPPYDDFRSYWRDEVAGRGPVVRFVTDPRFVPFSSLPEDEQREWLEWLNGKIETTRPYIDMIDKIDPKQAPSWDSTPYVEKTEKTMTGADIKAALINGGWCLACSTPLAGSPHRPACIITAIPDDAVLVTQESLARAIAKAFPAMGWPDDWPKDIAAAIITALAREEASHE